MYRLAVAIEMSSAARATAGPRTAGRGMPGATAGTRPATTVSSRARTDGDGCAAHACGGSPSVRHDRRPVHGRTRRVIRPAPRPTGGVRPGRRRRPETRIAVDASDAAARRERRKVPTTADPSTTTVARAASARGAPPAALLPRDGPGAERTVRRGRRRPRGRPARAAASPRARLCLRVLAEHADPAQDVVVGGARRRCVLDRQDRVTLGLGAGARLGHRAALEQGLHRRPGASTPSRSAISATALRCAITVRASAISVSAVSNCQARSASRIARGSCQPSASASVRPYEARAAARASSERRLVRAHDPLAPERRQVLAGPGLEQVEQRRASPGRRRRPPGVAAPAPAAPAAAGIRAGAGGW